MNTFVNAVKGQPARTTNGMAAFKSTTDSCVDLFYKIGALRNGDPIPPFTAAFAENPDLALRILQWARDVRGGAGERKVFRDILLSLEKTRPEAVALIIPKIPEIGRFDDLLIFTNPELKAQAFTLYGEYLRAAGEAMNLLGNIESLSEEECQKILAERNKKNGIS